MSLNLAIWDWSSKEVLLNIQLINKFNFDEIYIHIHTYQCPELIEILSICFWRSNCSWSQWSIIWRQMWTQGVAWFFLLQHVKTSKKKCKQKTPINPAPTCKPHNLHLEWRNRASFNMQAVPTFFCAWPDLLHDPKARPHWKCPPACAKQVSGSALV